MNNDELQKIINDSVQNDLPKDIWTAIFNQLMEDQRSEYIQADEYDRSITRKSQRNEKALLASMFEIYVSSVSIRIFSKAIKQLCSKSIFKSFVSSLTKVLAKKMRALYSILHKIMDLLKNEYKFISYNK